MRVSTLLLFAIAILATIATFRGPEYDEAYSLFLTAGHARPAWPTGVFQPIQVRNLYFGNPSFWQITQDLRNGDVHPPLYFWCLDIWRHSAGSGWFAARMLSVLFSTAALGALAWLALLAEIPIIPTLLFTLLSYGFAYTGIVARGFALAQLLNIFGAACIFAVLATPRRYSFGTLSISPKPLTLALIGGLAFGAASFTNYLASFTAIAFLFWLALRRAPLPRLAAAIAGFAIFLPADWYFFHAQSASRANQFDHFSLPHAIGLIARDEGAVLFGGLPVYAGAGAPITAAILMTFFGACLAFVYNRRNATTTPFALATIATPCGLLALGILFNKTPIEIRYLAFGMPYLALMFAQTLPEMMQTPLIMIEGVALIGLALAPATMQPQAAASRQAALLATPTTLVLLAYGNDGVGIPGPFIYVAPDTLRLQLVHPNQMPNLQNESRIILATVNGDAASRAANQQMLAAFAAAPCWRAGDATNLIHLFTRTCAAALPAN